MAGKKRLLSIFAIAVILIGAVAGLSYTAADSYRPIPSAKAHDWLHSMGFDNPMSWTPFMSTEWMKEIEGLPVPTAYWQFQEGAGTNIEDIAGGKDLTLSNAAAWNTDYMLPLSHFLIFTAPVPYTTTYYASITGAPVEAGGDLNVEGTTALTICVWIRPKTIGEGNVGRIFDKTGAYIAYIDNSDEITWLLYDSGGVDASSTTNSPIAPFNKWHFVALIYDGSVPEKRIYIGDLDGTLTPCTLGADNIEASIKDAGADLYVGDRSANDRAFNGHIAHKTIYKNTALTINQIRLWQRLTGGIIQGVAPRS